MRTIKIVELSEHRNALVRILFFAAALLSVVPALGQVQRYGEPDRESERVSLVAVLAAPENYQGKKVAIRGVAAFASEVSGLYLSKEHKEHFVSINALWLNVEISGVSFDQLLELDGKYVMVEGRVDAASKGHRGGYTATLDDVSFIALME